MAKRSITSQRILDESSDDWRPLEEVMAAVIPTVPPGKALRQYESSTKNTGIRPLTEDEKIRSGQRYLAWRSLRSLINSGKVEVRPSPSGDKMVRRTSIRPAQIPLDTCPHCLRPYDQAGEVVPPFSKCEAEEMTSGAKVIFPPRWNQRRFG
jgi:hypothetical protein